MRNRTLYRSLEVRTILETPNNLSGAPGYETIGCERSQLSVGPWGGWGDPKYHTVALTRHARCVGGQLRSDEAGVRAGDGSDGSRRSAGREPTERFLRERGG